MFSDDPEPSSEEERDTGTSASGHRKAEPSFGIGISEMSFSQKFAGTGGADDDIKKSEPTVKPPPIVTQSHSSEPSESVKALQQRLKEAEDSKRRLVQVLSQEFDRLRGIIKALSIQQVSTAT